MKVRYTPAAIEDMLSIQRYITDELKNPDTAKRIVKDIASACRLLGQQPDMGGSLARKLQCDIRGRFLIRGRYMIVCAADECVSVIRVLDTRTDYISVLKKELQ